LPQSGVSDMIQTTMKMTGVAGMVGILVTLVCIWLAWRGLNALKLDQFLKDPASGPARLLLLLLAIALGHQAAQFFLDYLQWSTQIRFLF